MVADYNAWTDEREEEREALDQLEMPPTAAAALKRRHLPGRVPSDRTLERLKTAFAERHALGRDSVARLPYRSHSFRPSPTKPSGRPAEGA